MSIVLLVVGLLLFIGLVVVHEFGHFIVARRNGVGVEEFGIFFPPRLYKKQTKNGWVFSFNAIPLGGFVKLKGEHDSDSEPGSFGAASLWVKSKIMAAGVVMNLVTALALLTVLALVGMPKLIPNQFTVAKDAHLIKQAQAKVEINEVINGSPAARAGLKANDQVLAIGPLGHVIRIPTAQGLQDVTRRYAGQKVEVQYRRNNSVKTTQALLNSAATVAESSHTKNPKGYLGVGVNENVKDFAIQRSTWSAPVVAVGLSAQITVLTFQGLGHAIGGLGSLVAGATTGNTVARHHGQTVASSQVAGPVGIFVIMKDGSLLGYQFMLFIIAIISLTLAIMNILPIPALDGGRLWITLVAHSLKRPLSARTEEAINLAGFLILISLMVLVTYVDLQRTF